MRYAGSRMKGYSKKSFISLAFALSCFSFCLLLSLPAHALDDSSGGQQNPQDTTDPSFAAPSLQCAIGLTNNATMTLSWDTTAGAQSYVIHEVGPQADQTSDPQSETSYVTTLSEDGEYTFSIQAIDESGQVSDWSTPCYVQYDGTAPTAPSINAPQDGSVYQDDNGAVTVSWTAVGDTSGIASYQIDYTINGDTHHLVTSLGTEDTQSFVSGMLNTQFSVRVRAVDAAGNTSAWSDARSYSFKQPVKTVVPVIGSTQDQTGSGGTTIQPLLPTRFGINDTAASSSISALPNEQSPSTSTSQSSAGSFAVGSLLGAASTGGTVSAVLSNNQFLSIPWFWWLIAVASISAVVSVGMSVYSSRKFVPSEESVFEPEALLE
jgi:hypothetical protein